MNTCPKCGAGEDDFHDEFVHMVGHDPLFGMKERIFSPPPTEPEDLTFVRWCGFRPQVLP